MNSITDVIDYLASYDGRPVKLMEICGTHTSSIAKNAVRSIISPKIRLCSGPGCPVCVTPQGYIDKLCDYAQSEQTVVLTFGDMMKVPGTKLSLSEAKALGGRTELFYSPFEAIEKAKKNPHITYIVAAVGFETTVPIYALMMQYMAEQDIKNIKFLTAVKRVIPVLETLCQQDNSIDGFIAPGHVSAVIGSTAYKPLSERFKKPFAVAGFSAEQVLMGIYDLIKQLEKGSVETHNLYAEVVRENGNLKAQTAIESWFETGETFWRGIGPIPDSGLYLKEAYTQYDAGSRAIENSEEQIAGCSCNDVIRGRKSPAECHLFGKVCLPSSPIGPCMVSGEGACGIWYQEGIRA